MIPSNAYRPDSIHVKGLKQHFADMGEDYEEFSHEVERMLKIDGKVNKAHIRRALFPKRSRNTIELWINQYMVERKVSC